MAEQLVTLKLTLAEATEVKRLVDNAQDAEQRTPRQEFAALSADERAERTRRARVREQLTQRLG